MWETQLLSLLEGIEGLPIPETTFLFSQCILKVINWADTVFTICSLSDCCDDTDISEFHAHLRSLLYPYFLSALIEVQHRVRNIAQHWPDSENPLSYQECFAFRQERHSCGLMASWRFNLKIFLLSKTKQDGFAWKHKSTDAGQVYWYPELEPEHSVKVNSFVEGSISTQWQDVASVLTFLKWTK